MPDLTRPADLTAPISHLTAVAPLVATGAGRALDEDDLPAGVTSAQQEAEYRELLAAGFFDPEPFEESPEPGFWSPAAAIRYGDNAAIAC